MGDTFEVAFGVDARLITQLGEQLVPSDVMALAELVKNSYDADATTVTVTYDSVARSLAIEDNGTGMTRDDFIQGWMTVGTSGKEREQVSPLFGRARVGRKGVGRFASQRLGQTMLLRTVPRSKDAGIEIAIDWTEFEAGHALGSVEHKATVIGPGESEQGTSLMIGSLMRDWREADFREVLADLAEIQAPPEEWRLAHGTARRDPGFEATFVFDGEPIPVVREWEKLHEERIGTLTGTVDAEGNAQFEVEFIRPSSRSLRERYPAKLSTGPLYFKIDLFVFDTRFMRGVRKAQALARKWGGVRIWRDGFRVFPYGEPGDDWLGLDAHAAARRIPLNMWRGQTVLGGVYLTQAENPGFVDLLTRRGLLENECLRELQEYLQFALRLAAVEHAGLSGKTSRVKGAKSTPSDEVKLQIEENRRKRADLAQQRLEQLAGGSRLPSVAEAARIVQELESSVREDEQLILKKVQESQDEFLSSVAMYRVLASLGTGLAAFSHELRSVLQPIGIATQDLENLASGMSGDARAQIEQDLQMLRRGVELTESYGRYIDEFISTSATRRRTRIELGPFLAHMLSTFGPLLDRESITVSSNVRRGLFTLPMHVAELNSILFNLLSNSVKALREVPPGDRRMSFEGRMSAGLLEMIVADTGCGIPEGVKNRIFDPFVSRSHAASDIGLGEGTGLGLAIVRDILDGYGSDIRVIEPPDGYETAFLFTLPTK